VNRQALVAVNMSHEGRKKRRPAELAFPDRGEQNDGLDAP
jgi:hypothetical protein